MKDMGVNAIRTTHNPASEQTLKIAAELGLMVQEEALIPGMVVRNNTITVVSLKRMPLTQKLVRGILGPITIYEPW